MSNAYIPSVNTFLPILGKTAEDAEAFCSDYTIPTFLHNSEDCEKHSTRIDLTLNMDTCNVQRVWTAELFVDGVSLGKVTTDDCGGCGGPCDGVHAKVFSIDAVHGMTQEELKKYCTPHDIPPYCVYAEPNCMALPYNIQKCSPDRLEYSLRVRKGDPRRKYYVYSAKLYKNNMVVAESVQSVKEKRVNELVDSILRNDRSIVDEVIKQMSASRVKHIVDTLMAQDPDVVTEVLERIRTY